jgi:multisubunit Na+/H+ antiporter MnhB subunit
MINNQTGMSLIVKTATRLSTGLILLYGVYIALQGNDGAGSGFAAGVIIALSFVLVMLSFGRDAVINRINEGTWLCLLSVSALIFLGVIAASILGAPVAFAHVPWFEKAMTVVKELCVAAVVGSGLFLIFLTLVRSTGGPKK